MKWNQIYIPRHRALYILLLSLALGTWGCAKSVQEESAQTAALKNHPGWTRSATIYEVNTRQYTPEGTFRAFQEHLPRLKDMGVDILWLMPIHPIGEKNRKGELGSYYSIKDYTAVNPHFGTKQDFLNLVDAAHEQGMKLILDWVPNHTAWDHPWANAHPEFYKTDSLGNITYEADWTDIAQLNYNNKDLWPRMIGKMKYWVEEAGIDGYRVDHAGHDIPLDFWKRAIPEINRLKEDLFWLAEWNTPEMHPWFDATYAWEYFHLTTAIARGEEPLSKITEYMARQDTLFPEHAYRMYFTTNHDENSWNGTDVELFGENFENFAVLATTIDGVPLVYSGQETGLEQRLEFFEKDTIEWDGYEYATLYQTLFELKDRNKALWNGQYGGEFEHLPTSGGKVYAYRRAKGTDEVLVILNFSDEMQDITFTRFGGEAIYTNVFSPNDTIQIPDDDIILAAHEYLVLEKW